VAVLAPKEKSDAAETPDHGDQQLPRGLDTEAATSEIPTNGQNE
jgi:hypothetical protein